MADLLDDVHLARMLLSEVRNHPEAMRQLPVFLWKPIRDFVDHPSAAEREVGCRR